MLLIPALRKHRQQDQRFRVLVSCVANLRHGEGKGVRVLFLRACLKSENNRDTDYRQYKKDGRTDRQTDKQADELGVHGCDLGSLCNSGVLVDVYNKLTVQLGRTKPHPSDL